MFCRNINDSTVCPVYMCVAEDGYHCAICRSCICRTDPTKCTSPISHNAPFCNRNVHICAYFCYKMVHCGIFVWRMTQWDSWDKSIVKYSADGKVIHVFITSPLSTHDSPRFLWSDDVTEMTDQISYSTPRYVSILTLLVLKTEYITMSVLWVLMSCVDRSSLAGMYLVMAQ